MKKNCTFAIPTDKYVLNTVRLVQLVEHQIVVLGVVGSSPTSHPKMRLTIAVGLFHFAAPRGFFRR